MAFVKVDPSQRKITAVLMVALLAAVVVTVVRLNPAPSAAPASDQQASAPSGQPASAQGEEDYDPSRNPFEGSGSSESSDVAEAVFRGAPPEVMEAMAAAGVNAANPWRAGAPPRAELPVEPLRVRPIPGTDSSPTASVAVTDRHPPVEPKPKPVFKLLATVADGEGCSAVIRTGDSAVRVVEVGDILDGGYKVKSLEAGRVVLTDGREIIVATKPES